MTLDDLRELFNFIDHLAAKVELSEQEQADYDHAVAILTKAINEAQA